METLNKIHPITFHDGTKVRIYWSPKIQMNSTKNDELSIDHQNWNTQINQNCKSWNPLKIIGIARF